MKKVLSFLMVAFIAATVYFCFFDEDKISANESEILEIVEKNPTLYPVYHRLPEDEKEIYIKICAATRNFEDTISRVYKGDSKIEVENFVNSLKDSLYQEIAYEHPDIFWYDPYNFEALISVNNKGEYFLDIKPSYLFTEEEVEEMTEKFDNKVQKIASVAKSKPNTYEQVLYIHDYIVKNCVYDDETYKNANFKSSSINAYGCLVEGKAICSGYAMAFNAVMKQLDFEVGVEFSSYNGVSIFKEEHVWNYCKLDDEYYYFDLTWDDGDPNSENYKFAEYNHSYFAITKDELESARMTLSPKAPTPECNGTKYNYFVYNNLNFNVYNFNSVKKAILSRDSQGAVELRFDSYGELLKAERDLLTNGRISEIFPNAETDRYYTSKSKLQLYIFLDNYSLF